MLLFYIPRLIGVLLLLIIFFSFMTDQPLKPPTHAMELKMITDDVIDKTSDFRLFINAVKSLQSNSIFVLSKLSLDIMLGSYILLFLQATTIAAHFGLHAFLVHKHINADAVEGILVSIYIFLKIILGFASGKISNKWKK